MADTSRSALGFGRWFTLCVFGLASALHGVDASAQTSVTNTVTVTPPSGVSCTDVATNPTCVRTASDTDAVVAPSINVAKSAVGVTGPSALGVYTVSYTITVTNSGTAAGTYGALTDIPVFPANTNITSITWTTSGTGAPAGGSSTIDGPNPLTGTGVAIGAGVTHTFNVSITYVYTSATTPTSCAATPTPGSGLYNSATLPAGQETVTTDNATCINPPAVPAASLSIDKTAGTPTSSGVGGTIPYTFVVTNTGTVTLNSIAVVDARLDAPAVCASTTLTAVAPGNTTTCTGVHTITAADVALGSVSNSATATGTTVGGIVVTSPPDTTVTTLVPVVDFCTANSVFNITQNAGRGEFYRYTVGSGTPDVLVPELTLNVAPNLNSLMVDPVRNRLLFISYVGTQATLHAYDAANGGWYVAAGPVTAPDFPRAGMTAAGQGYLVAGGANPAVWRVTASGAFNYTLTSYGNLTYDFAPTDLSSGDIAFDNAGFGWLTAGADLYRIDFSTPSPQAVRQQRPLFNGAPSTLQWAGVAYGSDGLLYVSTNASPSRYFRIDRSAGTLALVAATAANQSRDLASCSFAATGTPAQLRVVKTLAQVNGAAYVAGAAVAAGDTLTYRMAVTHVGGTLAATLFPGEVVETLPANTTVVAAGNDFTCTGSNCINTNAVNVAVGGTATLNFVVQVAAPFPTGATASIVNTVAVEGVNCATVGNDCGETTPVGLPAWTVVKSSANTAYNAVGNLLSYSYLVTNTGNVAINAIAIADDRTTNETCPAATLAAGASMTCTATYTVTQADLDAGSVTNNVSMTGTPTTGTLPPAIDDLTINATVTPSWTVVKSSANTAYNAVGNLLSYSYLVTNTGNVAINAIAIADDRTTNEACPAASLAAGASMTCSATYTVTQADLDAGSVTNTVTMTGTPSSGTLAPAIDDLTINAAATPTWTVVKSSTDSSYSAVGTVLDYSYLVTNTGNVTINAIAIADDRTTNEACPAATLAAGASMTCSATYTVTQADLDAGSVTNTVTLTGTPSSGTLAPAIDDLTINATVAPAWTVVKSSTDTTYAAVGDVLDYAYLVTNTGNVTINAIAIADDRTTNETCPAASLAAGASMTCTATYTVTQADLDAGSVTNTVTMTGTPSSGTLAPAIDDLTINATANPAWTVVKSSTDTTYAAVGEVLDYSYLVTNTGNVAINAIAIADDRTTNEACPAATLAAGASMTCSATYTVTQADLDAGSVTNTVTMTGTPSGGTLPPAVDDLTLNATAAPSLSLLKTAGAPSANTAGSSIAYSFAVTNTGNVTLTGIAVVDALLDAPAVCDVTTLLPGAVATCTGTHTITQAEVNAGVVNNSAIANGTPPTGPSVPSAPSTTSTPIAAAPALSIDKTAGTPSGNTAGSTIAYSFVVTNTGNVTLSGIAVVDALLDAPAVCDVATLAPGAVANCTGTHTITQAEVNAGTVNNSAIATGTPPAGGSTSSSPDTTQTPIAADPSLTVLKSAGAPSGNIAGSTIAYSFVVTNTGNVTLNAIAINDALLDAPAVCDATTLLPGAVANCTGTHTVTQADVAAGAVNNTATATGTPPSATPVTSDPSSTSTPLLAVTVSKLSTPASGQTVQPGETISYTLNVVVANTATTSVLTLTDTLSGDQTLTGPLPAGCASGAGGLVCTLAAGTAPGSYSFNYTTTVDADATGRLGNNVVPSGADNPTCSNCSTEHPIAASVVTVAKSSNPASGAEVAPGDTVVYTLSVTVANSITTGAVTLTDTISGDQSLSGALPAGCAASGGGLVCTLPAGTLPGSYSFSYSTLVAADATGTLGNVVVPSGIDAPTCVSCSTTHPVVATAVTVSKSSNPASGTSVSAGDTLSYTLTVTVANSVTTDAVTLTDTISGDQTRTGALPAGCVATASGLQCTLPAGTLPGTYTFAYTTLVDTDASGTLGNVVVPSGGDTPTCALACSTQHPVLSDYELRILKTVAVREVKIGDLVRYTLSVENVGNGRLINGSIVDTPPPGFSYVEGSLSVIDGDNQATAVGQSPLRFEGLDIEPGQTATLVYAMRVGAGVRPGVQRNQAQAYTQTGTPISNVSTAAVALVADALVDDSLLIGTVFDDRDGDTWQDSAALSGVRVQGGFAADAYVANSTTVDRGAGAQPEADASSPLLHGIDVGAISPRQSVADPVEHHQVVIRQRLTQPSFTNDFVLTSAQGVTVRMDAAGNTTVEKSGEAAKGLNAAEPKVERRIAQGEGGYVVDYVVSNLGIDERGIPGVRIASVEGLLIETDQFGRYHLEGIAGGDTGRGRNFILKVDPSTLPPGTVFTTDNPLVRRITPGLPVRFDFGVKLPVEVIEGDQQQIELELGEVIFAPGSAQIREQYSPVIAKIADKVIEYRGGEVLVSANGDSEALAFERAEAVKTALLRSLPEDVAKALTVSVRAEPDDPSTLLVGVAEGGPLLGTVLFDTDKAVVKPKFVPLIEKIADYLQQKGGGAVAVVGHADPRGSDAYNVDLGMRRAKAVYELIAQKLSPAVRAKVRVESSNDPAAPAGTSK